MNYRLAKVFAQKSYAADFTELIDINLSDLVSAFVLNYQGYNTSGSAGATAHWAKAVTKIELVDGSNVLFALDGMELQALMYAHLKRQLADWLHYLDNNYYSLNLVIPFGRWLYDADLALDPAKFNNLQLKVTNDMDAGGAAPDAAKLTVFAHCFDQKSASPVGFLQAKRIKQYTMAASSHEYTDLPMDYRIRKLLIKGLKAGTEPNQVIQTVKLSEDNDKRIAFDADFDELGWLFPDDNLKIVESFYIQNDGAKNAYYCTPTSKVSAAAVEMTGAADAYFDCIDGDGGRLYVDGSAAKNAQVIVTGFYPNGVLSIPFGDEWDPGDWFDPSGLKNLRLDLLTSSGSGTGTAEIILQQLRTY